MNYSPRPSRPRPHLLAVKAARRHDLRQRPAQRRVQGLDRLALERRHLGCVRVVVVRDTDTHIVETQSCRAVLGAQL